MNVAFQQKFLWWVYLSMLCLFSQAALAVNISGEVKLPSGVSPDAQPVQLYVIAWGNIVTNGETQLIFQEPLGNSTTTNDAIANSTTAGEDIISYLTALDVFGNIGTLASVEPVEIAAGQGVADYQVSVFNPDLPTSVSYLCVNNCSPFTEEGFYSNSAETTSNREDRAQLQAGQDFEEINLTLITGAAIFGVVSDAQGAFLDDVSVFARDTSNSQQEFMAFSNSEGEYFLNVSPNAAYQMLVSHPVLGELNENIIVQVGTAGVQQDFQFSDLNDGVIEGTVRAPNGQPLGDVVIAAFGFNSGSIVLSDFRITQTGNDGQYRLANLFAEAYFLFIWHKRFGSLPGVLVDPTPPVEQNFQFSAGGIIRGTVRGPSGQLVRNAQVTAEGDTLFDSRSVRTDRNGQYVLEGLQSDNYSIRVFHPDFGTLDSASDSGLHPVPANVNGKVRDFMYPERLYISGRVLGGPSDWRGVYGFVGVYQDNGDGIFNPRTDRFWDCAFVNGEYKSVPVPPGKYFVNPVVRGYVFDAPATVSLGGIVNGDSREVDLVSTPLTDVDLAIRSEQANGIINAVVTNPNNIGNINIVEISVQTGGVVVDSFRVDIGENVVIDGLDPNRTYTVFAHALGGLFERVGTASVAGVSGNNGSVELMLVTP